MLDALAVKHSHHRRHAAAFARLARHVDVALSKLFQRNAAELAASLDGRPIIQLIWHGDAPRRVATCVFRRARRGAEHRRAPRRYVPAGARPRYTPAHTTS